MPDSHVDPVLSRSLTRSLATTALFLKRQIWIWPLIAATLLVVIGYGARRKVDEAIHVELAAQLQTILNADVAGLEIWLSTNPGATHWACRPCSRPRRSATRPAR